MNSTLVQQQRQQQQMLHQAITLQQQANHLFGMASSMPSHAVMFGAPVPQAFPYPPMQFGAPVPQAFPYPPMQFGPVYGPPQFYQTSRPAMPMPTIPEDEEVRSHSVTQEDLDPDERQVMHDSMSEEVNNFMKQEENAEKNDEQSVAQQQDTTEEKKAPVQEKKVPVQKNKPISSPTQKNAWVNRRSSVDHNLQNPKNSIQSMRRGSETTTLKIVHKKFSYDEKKVLGNEEEVAAMFESVEQRVHESYVNYKEAHKLLKKEQETRVKVNKNEIKSYNTAHFLDGIDIGRVIDFTQDDVKNNNLSDADAHLYHLIAEVMDIHHPETQWFINDVKTVRQPGAKRDRLLIHVGVLYLPWEKDIIMENFNELRKQSRSDHADN
jgi:hypothetical protein